MVGACEIVAQRLRSAAAQTNAACIFHPRQQGEGVLHAQLKMLRGNEISRVHRLFQTVGDDDAPVGLDGLPGDVLPGQSAELAFQLFLHRFGKAAAVRHQNGGGQYVMLRLTEQVCCDP